MERKQQQAHPQPAPHGSAAHSGSSSHHHPHSHHSHPHHPHRNQDGTWSRWKSWWNGTDEQGAERQRRLQMQAARAQQQQQQQQQQSHMPSPPRPIHPEAAASAAAASVAAAALLSPPVPPAAHTGGHSPAPPSPSPPPRNPSAPGTPSRPAHSGNISKWLAGGDAYKFGSTAWKKRPSAVHHASPRPPTATSTTAAAVAATAGQQAAESASATVTPIRRPATGLPPSSAGSVAQSPLQLPNGSGVSPSPLAASPSFSTSPGPGSLSGSGTSPHSAGAFQRRRAPISFLGSSSSAGLRASLTHHAPRHAAATPPAASSASESTVSHSPHTQLSPSPQLQSQPGGSSSARSPPAVQPSGLARALGRAHTPTAPEATAAAAATPGASLSTAAASAALALAATAAPTLDSASALSRRHIHRDARAAHGMYKRKLTKEHGASPLSLDTEDADADGARSDSPSVLLQSASNARFWYSVVLQQWPKMLQSNLLLKMIDRDGVPPMLRHKVWGEMLRRRHRPAAVLASATAAAVAAASTAASAGSSMSTDIQRMRAEPLRRQSEVNLGKLDLAGQSPPVAASTMSSSAPKNSSPLTAAAAQFGGHLPSERCSFCREGTGDAEGFMVCTCSSTAALLVPLTRPSAAALQAVLHGFVSARAAESSARGGSAGGGGGEGSGADEDDASGGYMQGQSYLAEVLLCYCSVPESVEALLGLFDPPLPGAGAGAGGGGGSPSSAVVPGWGGHGGCTFFLHFSRMDLPSLTHRFAHFATLLEHNAPHLSAVLRAAGLAPEVYLLEYLATLGAKQLPLGWVARIWDGVVIAGEVFLMRAVVALFQLLQPMLLRMHVSKLVRALREPMGLGVFVVAEQLPPPTTMTLLQQQLQAPSSGSSALPASAPLSSDAAADQVASSVAPIPVGDSSVSAASSALDPSISPTPSPASSAPSTPPLAPLSNPPAASPLSDAPATSPLPSSSASTSSDLPQEAGADSTDAPAASAEAASVDVPVREVSPPQRSAVLREAADAAAAKKKAGGFWWWPFSRSSAASGGASAVGGSAAYQRPSSSAAPAPLPTLAITLADLLIAIQQVEVPPSVSEFGRSQSAASSRSAAHR